MAGHSEDPPDKILCRTPGDAGKLSSSTYIPLTFLKSVRKSEGNTHILQYLSEIFTVSL